MAEYDATDFVDQPNPLSGDDDAPRLSADEMNKLGTQYAEVRAEVEGGAGPIQTALAALFAAKVPSSRTIAGLDLTVDRSAAAMKTALGLVKADVGLGNVDNTADTAKPVSTAQQTALDLKAPLASPALTGNPTAPTASAGDNDTSIATTAFVQGEIASRVTSREVTLSNGGSLTVLASDDVIVFVGSTAATYTINLPAGVNGQRFTFIAKAQITALTIAATGATVYNPPTVLSAIGGLMTLAYNSTSMVWNVVAYLPGLASTILTRNGSGVPVAAAYASAATANAFPIRDASGRAQFASPSAAADVAIKSYVDGTTGIVAPVSTPPRIGAIFVDTALSKVYIAKGTASSADWVLVN